MSKPATSFHFRKLVKALGPGLLFASTAIGTSHLVLSTRAGAHHGMIYFWIILATLLLKYPFYEFAPRYAAATGHSLLKGYKDQGRWAVALFMMVICISMFGVVGAVGAVSAGLFKTMLGLTNISMPMMLFLILMFTGGLLLIGRYSALDGFIKLISVVLLVTVCTAFFAAIFKGGIEPVEGFIPNTQILEGAGLALMVGLIGFMPSGMEASTMYSIWTVEKIRTTHYHPTLQESLFDFKLGYLFTTVLAIMFLTIGALTVYGSGVLLNDPSAVGFSNKLIQIFTTHLGAWTFPVIALAAFGTIYGTLLTAWDAFARSFVEGLRVFKFDKIENNDQQQKFLTQGYNMVLPAIGVGGFFLFSQFSLSMIKLLDVTTVAVFLTAPITAFLNLRAITSDSVPISFRPSKGMMTLAYVGLAAMILFTIYYLMDKL